MMPRSDERMWRSILSSDDLPGWAARGRPIDFYFCSRPLSASTSLKSLPFEGIANLLASMDEAENFKHWKVLAYVDKGQGGVHVFSFEGVKNEVGKLDFVCGEFLSGPSQEQARGDETKYLYLGRTENTPLNDVFEHAAASCLNAGGHKHDYAETNHNCHYWTNRFVDNLFGDGHLAGCARENDRWGSVSTAIFWNKMGRVFGQVVESSGSSGKGGFFASLSSVSSRQPAGGPNASLSDPSGILAHLFSSLK